MSRPTRWALWLVLAAPLAGCTLSDEVLFQTFTGEGPATEAEMETAETVAGLGGSAPALQGARFRPPPISPGPTSESPAGNRIARLRAEAVDLQRALGRRDDELQFLRRAYRLHAEQYVLAVAAMELAPGDPLPANDAAFRADLGAARGALSQMQGDLLKMNSLAAQVAVDAATGNQLIQVTRELAVQAGTAAADREALSRLERELNATVQTAHRLLASLHADIGTQTNYAATQRVHLEELAAQVEGGAGATVQPVTATPPAVPEIRAPGDAPPDGADGPAGPVATPPPGAVDLAGRSPFVTIRFDRPRVAYRQPLYEALQAALERRPDAGFAVQGVAPQGRSTAAVAQRTAEVVQAMQDMGLPADRIAIAVSTAADAPTDQVRIYAVAGDPDAALTPTALTRPDPEAADESADVGAAAGSSGPATARRALVTIRFDRPEVTYEWPLYNAVKAALERKPDARFDLVAVSRARAGGVAADANARAEEVLVALTRMGLPASRVTLATTTSRTAADPEVRLYVR